MSVPNLKWIALFVQKLLGTTSLDVFLPENRFGGLGCRPLEERGKKEAK